MEDDQYFLLVALAVSLRSLDPSTQVGAIIVDPHGHIVSTGHNHLSDGLAETPDAYRRDGPWLDTKYPYMVCAELDALLSCREQDLRDHGLFTTLHPCHVCAKAIVQKGIREVVYLDDKHQGADFRVAAGRILAAAGVNARQVEAKWSSGLIEKLLGRPIRR